MKRKLFLFIMVCAAVLMPVVIGHAKPFYEGKVIQLIVTTKPGGGFDSYARLLAGTMEKYLPGSTIIVKTDYLDPVLIAKMLGAEKWQINTGYAGQEDQLAMIRGEIDAVVTSWSNGKSFIESGEGRVLMFNNDTPVSGYEKYPLLKDIVAKEYQPLIDLLLFMVMFNRPFAGPPDIPPDRLAVLREAFRKSWHDPEMLKKAEMMKRPVHYIGYAEGEKLIKNALNQPPEVVKLIKEAYGK